jgi:aryl-alcohol dehydrogenase-like predicted oxidoreductase
MALNEYVLLGRSGLRVTRLCLGTMTFGTDWGWGNGEDAARQILDRYLDSGGNFIDTADGYTNGSSEALIGKFLRARGDRERVVLATKYSFGREQGNANSGGNGRKNLYNALDTSLRRLQTDYIDLYWLHTWDGTTPVEEVMSALDDVVRSGKVRYIGFSNVPGWYLGRAQTLAELRGWTKLIALQFEYSLVERSLEPEFLPAMREFGLGLTPWSPLGGGILTGKYKRTEQGVAGDGRGAAVAEHPVLGRHFREKNFKIADEVAAVAKQVGRTPAQVALNWVVNRPPVDSAIIGATKLHQLEDNLAALDFAIPAELSTRLEEVSAPEIHYPYNFFYGAGMEEMVNAGTKVRQRSAVAA